MRINQDLLDRGLELANNFRTSHFALADFCFQYPSIIPQLSELSTFAVSTLRQLAVVARSWPSKNRFPLSFEHHKLTASLARKNLPFACKLMSRAVSENLTVRGLRLLIQSKRPSSRLNILQLVNSFNSHQTLLEFREFFDGDSWTEFLQVLNEFAAADAAPTHKKTTLKHHDKDRIGESDQQTLFAS